MTANNHKRYTQIGLDRRLRLKWLEQTATLVLAGNAPEAVKLTLQEDLRGSFHSSPSDVRGSLDKTLSMASGKPYRVACVMSCARIWTGASSRRPAHGEATALAHPWP